VDVWGPERASELAALTAAALPDEELSEDELLACCWDDPGVVFGAPDGSGAVSACVQTQGDRRIAFLKLLVVAPDKRRRGTGRALVEAVHEWAFEQEGAAEIRVGGSAPFYLWPGVDTEHLEALCLFESLGYWVTGGEVNMRVPTSFRADPPAGVVVRRAVDDADVERVLALIRRVWPWWEAEAARGIEHGCCHAAFGVDDAEDAPALGFACHSVNRAGWIGPMGTDPDRQHGGVGAAMLGQLCRDLQIAEYDHAEIGWVGPVSDYAKAAGARISRTFRSLTLLPPK
jgi:GNAT superfamily N-acetyltransferase